jgi:hypothetical protein
MTVQKFQVMSMGSQVDGEPTMHYQSTQSGVSSHKIVDGKQSSSTSGVMRATTRSKEAGVMIGGVSVHPDEAEAFIQEIEGEQAEAEEEAKQAEEQQPEVESFSASTVEVLDNLDKGDLANAVNLAVDGQLDDENLAKAVSSLGFGTEEGALEVGKNIAHSLSVQFGDIAEQEGFDLDTGWDALMQWNKVEAGKALHDWVNTRGQDSGRLREALREAWNNYGKADNSQLIQVLEEDGYEVRKTAGGGIVIKGNEFSDWTTWRDVRETFKKL